MEQTVVLKDQEISVAGKKPQDLAIILSENYEQRGLNWQTEGTYIEHIITDNFALKSAAEQNPASLFNAMLQASESGLSFNPVFQECYLSPYKIKHRDAKGKEVVIPTVKFAPMYRGKKKMLQDLGIVKDIEVELVHENDQFSEHNSGNKKHIEHKFNSFGDRGDVLGGYAVITMPDGSVKYIIKTREYFEQVKKASEAKMGKTSPAWKLWRNQMFKKALVNSVFSELSRSTKKTDAIELQNFIDTDADFVTGKQIAEANIPADFDEVDFDDEIENNEQETNEQTTEAQTLTDFALKYEIDLSEHESEVGIYCEIINLCKTKTEVKNIAAIVTDLNWFTGELQNMTREIYDKLPK
jgi:phage RecT family recombinase